ncbi:MAG: bifunctional phosphoribosylaminoimidazolecarboxamide formyltransferase/IMP cyclohydrolase [Phycisphaerales bacterium]|nr:bifunctional phosphoribosylaminoimidazolecarboxamide formyltransferase/IMP cyclohydrolase [Phycisphaerales bacterium]
MESIKITSALISIYNKTGIDTIVQLLVKNNIKIISTGGTHEYIVSKGIDCIKVEEITAYPSIFSGRVKTIHPLIFGGILYKRKDVTHQQEQNLYQVPAIDLVIVDLYPFSETLKNYPNDHQKIIENIDIGGPSMIRAAAKNYESVLVISSKNQYGYLEELLTKQGGTTTVDQRRHLATEAFEVVKEYDMAIADYFTNAPTKKVLRYGENPHQESVFLGDITRYFKQLHGKELSYNNLVDIDAGISFCTDIEDGFVKNKPFFAILKHTNICGLAIRDTQFVAWQVALSSDPESAFGGIIFTNQIIDLETATNIDTIFFEVLVAKGYTAEALQVLQTKKNRILLSRTTATYQQPKLIKNILGGILEQEADKTNIKEWIEKGGRETNPSEKNDLLLANYVAKHLKSNAIALVKNLQLIGKGCGQTSRIDALKQSIQKAKQFNFSLDGAVLASDAFFPFGDCVAIAHKEGIVAFIEPGGSIRDQETINYCVDNKLSLVITTMRHFKH